MRKLFVAVLTVSIGGCGINGDDVHSRLSDGDISLCGEQEIFDRYFAAVSPLYTKALDVGGKPLTLSEPSATRFDDQVDELSCAASYQADGGLFGGVTIPVSFKIRPIVDGTGVVIEPVDVDESLSDLVSLLSLREIAEAKANGESDFEPLRRADDLPPALEPLRSGGSVSEILPSDWSVEQEATGDLNGDGLEDIALVARGESIDRTLIILFNQGDDLSVAVENRKIIPLVEEEDAEDPMGDLRIESGKLYVNLISWKSMGTWWGGSSKFTFRWQGDGMKLIGYDTDFRHRASGATETSSFNFLSGESVLTSKDENGLESVVRKRISKKNLVDLVNIDNGRSFDPS